MVPVAAPPAAPWSRRQPERHRRIGLARHPARTAVLATAAIAAALLWGFGSEGDAGLQSTAALLPKLGRKTKVLASYRGWEVVLQPRKGKGPLAAIPKLALRETPPPPIVLDGLSGTTDGTAESKELLGFPFTTHNKASIGVGFPRVGTKARVSLDQPPQTGEDVARPDAQVELRQQAGPWNGNLRLRSTGEWDLSADADVKDLGGHLHATLRSDLDWSADLDMNYPPVKGVAATVSYGATQDGMRIRAHLIGEAAPMKKSDLRTEYSYAVENVAGKYAPRDFLHSGGITLSAVDGRHQVEVRGDYNRRYPKLPVRGSVRASSRNGPLTLEASADHDRYQLRGIIKNWEVAAAQQRLSVEGVAPTREFELKLGKLSAVATSGPEKPRVRFGLAL